MKSKLQISARRTHRSALLILCTFAIMGCRKEDPILPQEKELLPPQTVSAIQGFYLLNEGNMNMNKATLDYYDYATGAYRRNVYGQANPQATLSLGDVGNDLRVYGAKLYAVINCSNKVEVMDAATAKRIKVIEVKNGRYLAFARGKVYVSAYDGEVQVGQISPNGFVAEIDTTSLTITRTVMVGRQPEELEVVGNKLYVTNSGGYSPPNFERVVTVIDINTFTKIKEIDVAPNLHRIKADGRGRLYVSSRGNSLDIPSKLFVIDTQTDAVQKSFELPCSNIAIAGDTAFIMDANNYNMIDLNTQTLINKSFLPQSVSQSISTPYGIAVDPVSKSIYITDATDYLSPGKLYCIDKYGNTQFSVTTGDIPAHIAFVHTSTTFEEEDTDPPIEPFINCIAKVFEYVPAPGQFINTLPAATAEDTPKTMSQKAETALTNGGMICLGGFGGYVLFGLDHTIENKEGNDFVVVGNAIPTWAEPGVIMVSYDANQNGLPDDEWFEIAGSEYHKSTTIKNYEITYYKPESEPANPNEPHYIRWTDNQGKSGYLAKNQNHTQSYYPLWMGGSYTLKGTFMEANIFPPSETGGQWISTATGWGYADYWPNHDSRTEINIAWAVDKNGDPVTLKGIDFVRIHTGNRAQGGLLGEISTEIVGLVDLHLYNKQ